MGFQKIESVSAKDPIFLHEQESKRSNQNNFPKLNMPAASSASGDFSDFSSNGAIPSPRPWVRFFARMLDIHLYSLLFATVLFLIGGPSLLFVNYLVYMIFPMIWVFIEPVFLSRWGATPGKIILSTRVIHQNGGYPTYKDALRRSIAVWFRGEAMYIPYMFLIANIIAYIKLTTSGCATWDRDGSFTVQHFRIGPLRIMILIAIIVEVNYIFYLMRLDVGL